jgi:hypothetical protein
MTDRQTELTREVQRLSKVERCEELTMSHPLPTHADRAARSLKRLGFRMTRTGRSFCVIDATGELAVNSKPGMSLARGGQL